MTEVQAAPQPVAVGRTWADILVMAVYGALGIAAVAALVFVVYRIFGEVPLWMITAVLASLIFVPWIIERAKDDARLFMVVDGPMRLTEYRIGRRVPLSIEGTGVGYWSNSGAERVLLTAFDPETGTGVGSPLAEFSQFEQIRQVDTLDRLAEAFRAVLEEDRITMQTVGIEVERKATEVVDWALQVVYGSLVPTEISEALGIESKVEEPDMIVNETVAEMVDDDV